MYRDVYHLNKGGFDHGELDVNVNEITFKTTKDGHQTNISLIDVNSMACMFVSNGLSLQVTDKNNKVHMFTNFSKEDMSKIDKFFEDNNMTIQYVKQCLRGVNFGSLEVNNELLQLQDKNEQTIFQLPLQNVTHCSASKNEVTLQFHRGGGSGSSKAPVSLVEMKFAVNSTVNPMRTTEAMCEELRECITKRSDISAIADKPMVELEKVACSTPRGGYTVRVYPNFIQMSGASYDLRVPVTSAVRLFYLSHNDKVLLVLQLSPAVSQGTKRYSFLVFDLMKKLERTVSFFNSNEGTANGSMNLSAIFDDEMTVTGNLPEILKKIFSHVCKLKPVEVFDGYFSRSRDNFFVCLYKAGNGFVFPLEKGFFFGPKMPLYVKHADLESVNFMRSESVGKTFDFVLRTNNGSDVVFSGIEKSELAPIIDYCKGRGLKIVNEEGGGMRKRPAEEMEDDDEESEVSEVPVKGGGDKNSFRVAGGSDSDAESDMDFNPAAGRSESNDEGSGNKGKGSEEDEEDDEEEESYSRDSD